MNSKFIDVTFDVRTDSGHDRDPDKYSSTLRAYHKILWSKELPNGKLFDLNDNRQYNCLYHRSELGEFWLTSDSIIPTYRKYTNAQDIIRQIPENEINSFYDLAHTIGGYTVFPANRIDGKYTINQARGVNKAISDRMDITLECIRLYYENEPSPLADTILRYSSFFALFKNFKGYCEFFLFQDLVTADYANVKFFLPFAGFDGSQMPKNVDEYRVYMDNNIEFLMSRNKRIDACNY
jgi:hypothetical protein